MNISIFTASGSGQTRLAAFDSALRNAGVANYNLIHLSSVIPPHTAVLVGSAATVPGGEWGDKLYCVYATAGTSEPGREVWAGLGWVVSPGDGRGLFVEHTGSSKAEVDRLIRETLATMTQNRGYEFGEVQTAFANAICESEPVAALALATYEVGGWATNSS